MKNRIYKIILVGCLGVFLSLTVFSQSRNELVEQRKRLMREIKKTSQLLSTTQKDKKAALDQFYALQRQIEKREELIATLQKEKELSVQSLERTRFAIEALKSDIERLQKEYGILARQAYRTSVNHTNLLFLFSSTTFNQAVKRYRYIKQYDAYRKKQAKLILDTRSTLSKKLESLEEKKQEQDLLLITEELQRDILKDELSYKNRIIKDLEKDESKISRVLRKKRLAHEQLNRTIEKVIIAEMNRKRREERLNTPPKSEDRAATRKTEVSKAVVKPSLDLSADFQQKKGNLIWPVKNGDIVRFFGKQPHPIHKNILIANNGIDIRTNQNNNVYAIFSGSVVGVQEVPGYNYTVIIQHGDYYSVYSNLAEVFVNKGQEAPTLKRIGIAANNSQGATPEVHFEIWRGKTRLNPVDWLKRR